MIEHNSKDDWGDPGGFHTYPDRSGIFITLGTEGFSESVAHDLALPKVRALYEALGRALAFCESEAAEQTSEDES